jgi:hypothetical protein
MTRGPSRRTVVVATLLAVAAGTTVALATGDTPTRLTADRYPTAEPAPDPTGATEPTATPASASPTGSSPSAAPRTTAAGATAPGPTVVNAGYQTVAVPYRAGRTSWDVTAYKMRLRVSISHLPRVGEPVTWHASASSSVAGCCDVAVAYGDGTSDVSAECLGVSVTPAMTKEHVYNKAGRHQVRVVGSADHHCDYRVTLLLTLDVAPGTPAAQGALKPVVDEFDGLRLPDDPPLRVAAYIRAHDDDGWIGGLVVDWGDGTSTQVGGDTHPCTETANGWPARSDVQPQPLPAHSYATAGTYTITLTVTSTGCDGTQPQTARATTTFTTATS